MIRSISATIGEISHLLIVLSCLSLIATTLNADTLTTYEIQNATFSQGGTLEGSFVYDATTEEITDFFLLTSPDGFFFPNPHISPFGDNQELTADNGNATLVLRYGDLNSSGRQLELSGTMTNLDVGQDDFLDFGTTIATPEPGTIPILLFGALGLIRVRQWRRIRNTPRAHVG